ncbi:glycosyltransferase family 4 protein [Algiphilus sp.]|uniref:glycosyltransferase family 4 protein n=1 Tax=Algiphilus sp. TaxID=1872431 RepID=UPI003BAB439B
MLRVLGPNVMHIVLGPRMAQGLTYNYGVDPFRIRVLGNAGFVRRIPDCGPRRQLRTIGFIGNITPAKGIYLALEAMAQAQSQVPELRCLIAGPITDVTLRSEVEAFCHEAPERRVWLGAVQGAEKEAFFREIDLLLFPSRYPNEALPVTIYEALSAAVPVLATPRGCVPDQLSDIGGVISDEEYVNESVSRIVAWSSDCSAYTAVSRTAFQSFLAQLGTDQALLEALMNEVAQ